MVIPLVTPSRFLFSDFLQQFTVNSNPHPAGSRRRFLLPEDISQVVQKSGGGEEQRSGRPVIHVVEKILGILIALSCCQRQPAASGIPILRHLLAKQIELAQCVLSELVSLLGRCHQPLERLLHILGEQLSLKKELISRCRPRSSGTLTDSFVVPVPGFAPNALPDPGRCIRSLFLKSAGP